MDRSVNRLVKWRAVLAGWQLGTRSKEDGECLAVRDHREVTLMLRAEVNALTGVLIAKGVFTGDEFAEHVAIEADFLDAEMAAKFPGMKADDNGIVMTQEAAETMKRLHFPA
jgi:hypothetical protein